MQTGFCRNGINFKASMDALIILRGFFYFTWSGETGRRIPTGRGESPFAGSSPASATKISGSNRFFPDSLKRWIENEYQEKQALLAPATCTMINGLYKRVMAFFASCEHFRYSKRFDSWNENKSILILYMGSGLGHGERCSNARSNKRR